MGIHRDVVYVGKGLCRGLRRYQSDGRAGWELVCVLDQATDDLKHNADARMLLFKRPLVTYETRDNRPEPMGPDVPD